MKKLIPFLFFTLLYMTSNAQELSLYKKELMLDGADTLKYRILYPENFDAKKKYPIVFFLHGSGERGNDNEAQLTHGAKLFLSSDFRKNHPSIVIFPQCAANSYWSNVEIDAVNTKRFFNFKKDGAPTSAMVLLLKLVDQTIKQPYANKNQVYVAGLSMGGMGTLELLRRKPKTFAAAISICGGDNALNAKKYKNVPLWLFHGGLDDVVHPQFSYNIYKELKNLGHEPKFTIYLKANHNSWDSAFAESELMNWLFGHVK